MKMNKDMKEVKTNFSPVNVRELGLNIRRGKKDKEGSCSLCNDRDRYDIVNVIDMKSLSFRLCDKCKKLLKKIL